MKWDKRYEKASYHDPVQENVITDKNIDICLPEDGYRVISKALDLRCLNFILENTKQNNMVKLWRGHITNMSLGEQRRLIQEITKKLRTTSSELQLSGQCL